MSYIYPPDDSNQDEIGQYSFALLVSLTGGKGSNSLANLHRIAPDVALYPAGNQTKVAFDREGANFGECVLIAIREVESVPGLQVTHVDRDELVWASEIADRSGLDLTTIQQLITDRRGPAYFPLPANPPSPTPLWRWAEVAEWFRRWRGMDLVDPERTAWIEAINALLAARPYLAQLPPDQRAKLAQLLK